MKSKPKAQGPRGKRDAPTTPTGQGGRGPRGGGGADRGAQGPRAAQGVADTQRAVGAGDPLEERVERLLAGLTLREKASLCSGATSWDTQSVPAKGIPSVTLSDGPTGLRRELPGPGLHRRTARATCYPTQSALACSWDPALARAVGAAIGAECRRQRVHILLAPGVNIKRSPLCGRNFEYYSEDPLLSGLLAVGFIKGLQQAGAGCSLKHFAANNQETLRMCISSELDQRALHEIYLRPFEIAVRQARPATVMCAYNKLNGIYASENRELLTHVLREKWGFEGIVVSDWGAVCDRVAGIRAGMDLEMPGNNGLNDEKILQAVQGGRLREEELDAVVRRLLRFVLGSAGPAPAPAAGGSRQANHRLAVRAARRSAVLLKNEGVLPLAPSEKVLFVGEMACRPRIQGSGSSMVQTGPVESPLQAAQRQGLPVRFALGWQASAGPRRARQLACEAVRAAAGCDKVVLFLGLTDAAEGEGADRRNLRLSGCQTRLLELLDHETAQALLDLCSKKGGWGRLLRGLGRAVGRLVRGGYSPA